MNRRKSLLYSLFAAFILIIMFTYSSASENNLFEGKIVVVYSSPDCGTCTSYLNETISLLNLSIYLKCLARNDTYVQELQAISNLTSLRSTPIIPTTVIVDEARNLVLVVHGKIGVKDLVSCLSLVEQSKVSLSCDIGDFEKGLNSDIAREVIDIALSNLPEKRSVDEILTNLLSEKPYMKDSHSTQGGYHVVETITETVAKTKTIETATTIYEVKEATLLVMLSIGLEVVIIVALVALVRRK